MDLEVLPFEPIDSSNVAPELWVRLADIIRENYERYDGFVVLHGTDTMSYSSSALSFMLENLGKPVVFTGSQIPIGVLRTDGRENLITAIEIAARQGGGAGHCTRGVALFPEQAVPGEPDEKAQRRGAQRVRFAQLSRARRRGRGHPLPLRRNMPLRRREDLLGEYRPYRRTWRSSRYFPA